MSDEEEVPLSTIQFDQGVKNHPGYHVLASFSVLLSVVVTYHLLEKRRSTRNWIAHLIYFSVAGTVIYFLPYQYSNYLFSAITESLVGIAIPIYESVRAICTPDDLDDKAWLQYWIAGGAFFMFSTWVDDAIRSDYNTEIWYECTLFMLFWLYFPPTSGASILFEYITKPYIAARVKPLATKMDNAIEFMIHTLVNASHLAFLWVIFIVLPKGLKRMVTIAVGTAYPLVSSITAASTEDVEDDTYWLTYWSVYGILFIAMDLLEAWFGWIPGFYSLIIFSTIYLMLPMFQGADKVFRKILVPLAGLQELLMLRDAITVKKSMLKTLTPERAKRVSKVISRFYDDEDLDESANDPLKLKEQVMEGWNGLKLPSVKKMFGKKGSAEDTPASETTPLVV